MFAFLPQQAKREGIDWLMVERGQWGFIADTIVNNRYQLYKYMFHECAIVVNKKAISNRRITSPEDLARNALNDMDHSGYFQ